MAELRKRGLVTAVIVSHPFKGLGKNQAKVLGVPELPMMMIPHPLGGISLDEVKARHDVALPQFVELLKEHRK